MDLQGFFKAINPTKTLKVENAEDRKYYIDFSSVRGGQIIEELKDHIILFSPDEPTCTLFTGHIGCGKSTELFCLKAELEQDGFHVVYFESSEDLELTDVDISDILLAIARRISQSLENLEIAEPKKFKELLQGAVNVLNSQVTGVKFKFMGNELGVTSDQDKFTLALGIGEITTKTKSDPNLREKLNQYLAPQKTQLLDAINRELIEPAIAKLKQLGKKGLVVIVDNLDRLDNRQKPWGRSQPEYLFVDQGEYLTKLHCHLVYTMPLALKFSNDYGNLTQRFLQEPKVLPMVTVKLKDGGECEEGIMLLKKMVMARVFPDRQESERFEAITEVFEDIESLNRLCYMSGGHVRDLLRLLTDWLTKGKKFPLSRKTLEELIRQRYNNMIMPISDQEWDLLRQVKQRQRVTDDDGYQKLIRSRFVFEYHYDEEIWFDLNPILAEAKELQL